MASPSSLTPRGAGGALRTDAALRVLANPALRMALELVSASELSSGQLADACGWTRPAASQNLRALREAQLVDVRADGNRRLYRARAESLAALRAFLDDFWATRLGALAAEIGEPGRAGSPARRSTRRANR